MNVSSINFPDQPAPILLNRMVLFVATLAVLLIGILDYATGWEVSLFVFYAVPIVWVVWKCGAANGAALACLAAIVWWIANEAANPYMTKWGYAWAAASRLVYFLSAAYGAKALKAQRDADRARIAALERARQLEAEILRVAESEQQRIGQDLHDGLCQHLAAIGCAAKSLADDLKLKSPADSDVASDIETLLKDAVVQARDLARGIFPVQVNSAGLSAALEELASLTNRLTRISVTFEETGDVQLHDPEAAMHLYRIAQEALGNALKHGHGTKVVIRLCSEGDGILLTIDDDGEGFSPSSANQNGMGLKTMEYRAKSIGADLEIRRSPLGGTCVACHTVATGRSAPPFDHD